MEKELLLLPKKLIVFIIFISSLTYNSTFAQCANPTNPIPTGDASQEFCKTDDRTVESLVASGGTIVWYDSSSGGVLYGASDVLVNNTTYYADDISGGSCSTSRLAVT
ncbi:MAG: hypothetical protein P1P79_06820, partial [Lutibacter sp.]|nr:hypothetical protein [Lutibacter sp.]